MKKVLSIIAVLVLLAAGLFLLSGCGENKNEATTKTNPNAKEYVIDATYGGKFTFEFPTDLGYEAKEEKNKIVLTNKENGSTISFYTMDTSKTSIIMKEKDFSSSAYYGYKTLEINGHEAFTINRNNDFDITYGILFDKDVREGHLGQYYGVKIVVSKSSLKLDQFDPAAFVQTEAFQNLLNSIKVTPAEATTTTTAE